MKRVTGIGGIFFKCKDREASRAWYANHLGIQSDQYGGCFEWHTKEDTTGHTVWSPFASDTRYFEPSLSPFMVNYRVADLEALLQALKTEGVTIIGETEENEFGKFAWILDPDGIKLELWQAPQNFSSLCSTLQKSE